MEGPLKSFNSTVKETHCNVLKRAVHVKKSDINESCCFLIVKVTYRLDQ